MTSRDKVRKEKWEKAWISLIKEASPDFLNGLAITILNGSTSPIQEWAIRPLQNFTDEVVPKPETRKDKKDILCKLQKELPEQVVCSPERMIAIDTYFQNAFDYDKTHCKG